MKEKIKKIRFLRKIVKNIKISNEYNNDRKHFIKYYMDAGNTKEQLEYKMIFYSHSLEKGMTYDYANINWFNRFSTWEKKKLRFF